MAPEDISGEVKLGAFSANQVRSREIYHLSVKYGMRWENLRWVNTFWHEEEAKKLFKEIKKYPGDYPEKIYTWAHSK